MKKIFLIVAIFFLMGAGCGQVGNQPPKEKPTSAENGNDKVFCAQDVKECPDGSFVGRDPENDCQFEPCPEMKRCDAVNECQEGKACYVFEDEDQGTCYIGDPCNRCPSGQCTQAESDPPKILCE